MSRPKHYPFPLSHHFHGGNRHYVPWDYGEHIFSEDFGGIYGHSMRPPDMPDYGIEDLNRALPTCQEIRATRPNWVYWIPEEVMAFIELSIILIMP